MHASASEAPAACEAKGGAPFPNDEVPVKAVEQMVAPEPVEPELSLAATTSQEPEPEPEAKPTTTKANTDYDSSVPPIYVVRDACVAVGVVCDAGDKPWDQETHQSKAAANSAFSWHLVVWRPSLTTAAINCECFLYPSPHMQWYADRVQRGHRRARDTGGPSARVGSVA